VLREALNKSLLDLFSVGESGAGPDSPP